MPILIHKLLAKFNMKIEQLIGTWRSQDIPMHYFKDGLEITLHISGNLIGTLWILDENKDAKTIAEGKISINQLDNDNFNLIIKGNAIDDKFLTLSSRMYMGNKPAAFLINVYEYGERYFQKLE